MYGYIQAHIRKIKEKLDRLPSYRKEQAQWRIEEIKLKSPKCFENNECVICGCDIESKVFEDRACSKIDFGETPCYPKMMSKKQWEKFKKLNNVNIYTK